MPPSERLGLITVVLLVSACPIAAAGRTSPPSIRPLQTVAEFARGSSPTATWSTYIYTSDGRRAYVMWFSPEYDVAGNLVVLELVLNRIGRHDPDFNLLAPSGNWHGLQPYTFAGSDLAHGPERTGFGASRTISAGRVRLVVKIVILAAKVSKTSTGSYQVDQLRLSIDVENLQPAKAVYPIDNRSP